MPDPLYPYPSGWPYTITTTGTSGTTVMTGSWVTVLNSSTTVMRTDEIEWLPMTFNVSAQEPLDNSKANVYGSRDGIETFKPEIDAMPNNIPLTKQNASDLTRPMGRAGVYKFPNGRAGATIKVTHEMAYNQLNFNNWNRVAASIERLKDGLTVLKNAHIEPEFFKGTTAYDRPYFLLADHLKKRRQQYKELTGSLCKRVTHYEYIEKVKRLGKTINIRKSFDQKTAPKELYKTIKAEAKKQLQDMRRAAKNLSNKKQCRMVWRNQWVHSNGRFGAELLYQGGLPSDASENRILRMQGVKHIALCFQPKYPQTQDKHFGIEIEFIAAVQQRPIAEALAKHNLARYCLLKGDGSIRPTNDRPYGHELNICVPIAIAKPVIDKICEILRSPEINGDINTSCGLHVHLDMRASTATASDQQAEKSFKQLVASQMMLRDMQPDSRKTSSFCAVTPSFPFRDAIRSGRYFIVNGSAYPAHTTLEIRVSSASINPTKINNWAVFLGKIAYNYTPTSNGVYPTTLKGWAEACSMSEGLVNWAAKRLRKHTPQSTFLSGL